MAVNLALGIGPLGAAVSLVRHVLTGPLPFADGDRIVQVLGRPDEFQAFTLPDIRDLRAKNRSLEALTEFGRSRVVLCRAEDCRHAMAARVSADFFRVFKVRPNLGRTFIAGEDLPGASAVVVLSDSYWRRSFAADPRVLGQVLYLNDQPHTVIGVLPALPFPDADVIAPFLFDKFRMANVENRENTISLAFGLLANGRSLDFAEQDLSSVFEPMRGTATEAYPPEMQPGLALVPLRRILVGQAQQPLSLLLVAAGLLFGLTCVNVANIVAARFAARSREIGVRCALGASSRQLGAQLLVESATLAFGGFLLGLLFAGAALEVFLRLASEFTPRAVEVSLDLAPLAVSTGLAALLGGAIGGTNVFFTERALPQALGEGRGTAGGLSQHRRRSLLMSLQVTLSLMLLVGATLLLRSFIHLSTLDLGYEEENVFTAAVQYEHSTPERRGERCRAFQRQLGRDARSLPGVEAAGDAGALPLTEEDWPLDSFELRGQPPGGGTGRVRRVVAGPGYFETLRIPLLRGRYFEEGDSPAVRMSSAAIVNRAFEARFLGGRQNGEMAVSFDRGHSWQTIVGVVANVRQGELRQEPQALVYMPLACMQFPWQMLVRATTSSGALQRELQIIARRIDPGATIYDVRTLASRRDEALRPTRLMLAVVGLLSIVAAGTSLGGVASLVAFLAGQREREVAIRAYLGATPGSLCRLVAKECIAPLTWGSVMGLGGAFALSRGLSASLFGVGSADAPSYAAALLLLDVTAVGVAALVARRSTRVDLAAVLKTE